MERRGGERWRESADPLFCTPGNSGEEGEEVIRALGEPPSPPSPHFPECTSLQLFKMNIYRDVTWRACSVAESESRTGQGLADASGSLFGDLEVRRTVPESSRERWSRRKREDEEVRQTHVSTQGVWRADTCEEARSWRDGEVSHKNTISARKRGNNRHPALRQIYIISRPTTVHICLYTLTDVCVKP